MMGLDILKTFSNSSGHKLIPARDPLATSGSLFIAENLDLGGKVREDNILHEFVAGNIPNFLRNFTSITVKEENNSITYLVMTDYLSIGSDADYVRMPMNPLTAQKIADQYDCTLPTRKMVNDIWTFSINKLSPLPWGPPYDASMQDTSRVGIHNSRIQAQLMGRDFKALTSGSKKDIVLTNKLYPKNPNKRVAIYGWIKSNGDPIQPLNPISHEDSYEDYSHGVRLIAKDVLVNGKPMRINDIFVSSTLSALVSDEGVLNFTRY